MKKQFFMVLAALLCGIGLNTARAEYPAGAVQGVFTVGENTKVVFSHGNLQYKKSNGEWRFADHQYDIVGEDNSRIDKATYGGYIDLFGWGTGNNPTAYSCTACEATFDMAGNDPDGSEPFQTNGRRNAPMDYEDFTDWGNHAIANGGNQEGLWRTLTSEEWYHLFFVRNKHAERFGLGKVNGVQGLILLPDEWTLPSNTTFVDALTAGLVEDESGTTFSFPNPTADANNYTMNDYSIDEWQAMENQGAVFLPAAGSRAGTDCSNIGDYGFYWAADSEDESTAFSMGFTESLVAPKVGEPRASGQSVRLVAAYEEEEEPTVEPEDGVNTNFKEHPFTVNGEGGQVYFSQGNLQYRKKLGEPTNQEEKWIFASRQTDVVGEDNTNVNNCEYVGWLDLFVHGKGLWGDWVGYNIPPIGCSEIDPEETFDLPSRRNAPMGFDEEFVDWGDNNISNGGNVKWRTMTADEWSYIFLSRGNASGLFGFATVHGVAGLIVLPDDWVFTDTDHFVPASAKMTMTTGGYDNNIATESVFSHNVYPTTDNAWKRMEAAGAVFLPAEGLRTKTECSEVGESGYYWSSDKDDSSNSNALVVSFNNNTFRTQIAAAKEDARSVRLVRDLHQLTVKADPTEGGMVLENGNEITGGVMAEGETKTLTVQKASEYKFTGWEITADKEELAPEDKVSTIEPAGTNGEYIFTMGTVPTILKAKFEEITEEEQYNVTIEIVGEGYVTIDNTIYNGGDIIKINDGEEIEITAVPNADEGYEFANWEDGSSDNPRTITVTSDMTIEATFAVNEDPTYTVTVGVNDADGGYVTDEDNNSVDGTTITGLLEGETVVLTAVKYDDYNFTGWTVTDGVTYTTDGSDITITIGKSDVTVMANFEAIPTYTVTVGVNDADGGYVTDEDNNSVDGTTITGLLEGETVVLTAVKYDDYSFTGWTVTDGVTYTTDGNDITITIGKSDVTVMANFEVIPTYTVTVGVNDAAGGYVTDEDNNSVDGTTITGLLEGETVVLTAVKYDDYNFTGWTVTDGVTYTTDGNDITITIGKSDVTVMANFEEEDKNTLSVVVTPANSGTVYMDGIEMTVPAELNEGDVVILTAFPAENYEVEGMTVTAGDGTIEETADGWRFTMGTESSVVTATFKRVHVHTWSAWDYEWAGDYSTCTATRVCEDNAEHTETVSGTVTSTTTPATCEEAGVIVYTATFEGEGLETQVFPVEIPALGHDWGEPTYEWSKDHTTCTAKRVCKRDASHVEEETGTATVATEGGVTVYTVTYENEAFETQTYRPHLDITMSEYGFLSLYADKAYVVPSDLTAIIYTGISGRVLTYQQLTVIPAYTGVVFWGRANRTYSLAETTTTDDYSSVNMLSGTLTETVIPNDGNVHYILTRLEGTNQGGLYWPYGTVNGVGAFTNHKGKAYLTIPASAGFAPRYFTLQGRACEEGTAVDETEADGDGKYYDILGREVREPQPQQIYIHNGKKVLYGE